MALVWADGFDQYGSTLSMANLNTLMLQMGYSVVTGPFSYITGAAARTGIALRFAGSSGQAKRPLSNPASVLGMGAGCYQNSATAFNALINSGFAAESAAATEWLVKYNASNGYDLYDRTGTKVGSTPPNVAPLATWQWVEVKATINTGGGVNPNTGIFELRINGVTQLLVNGINLPNQFTFARLGGNSGDTNYDDWIIWDGSGTQNKDFLGDRRLVWSIPNAATAQADFTASAGTTISCINAAPPPGAPAGDTAFIQGAAAGNISDFGRSSVNVAGNDIAAVILLARLAKSDAGACTGTIGINSNGNVLNSVPLNPGTSFGYFQSVVELDPNGNVPWTRAAVDAALSRITRTV